MQCSEFLVYVATILTVLAIGSLLVAFCTDNWHQIIVDNDIFYPNVTNSTEETTTEQNGNATEEQKEARFREEEYQEDVEPFEMTESADDVAEEIGSIPELPNRPDLDPILSRESNPIRTVRVKRDDLPEVFLSYNGSTNKSGPYGMSRFYCRTMGLFRICFLEAKPPGVEGDCIDIDYSYIETYNTSTNWTPTAFKKLHAQRGVVALLGLTIFLMFMTLVGVCLTGFCGRIPATVAGLGICLFMGFLTVTAAMGTCTLMEIYEFEQWEKVVTERSKVLYDWSYWMAVCAGIFALIATILFFVGSCCLHAEQPREEIFTSELYYYD